MAGTADGSIIATIISHHMRMSAGRGGSRIAAMPPAGIPAPAEMYHQPTSASSATPLTTIARSWRRIRLVRSGADDTVRGKVQIGELAVAVLEIDLDRAAGAARRTADVG